MSFWDLFKIDFEWTSYTILLTIAFGFAGIVGYALLYKQIHLVKAETMSILDHVKCILYGFVFACGVTIILTTLSAFRIFKKTGADTSNLARHLLWPLNFVILILYIIPLVDFVYMAVSDTNKGLTIFQEFFAEKIIHRFSQKWKRYLIAISLWIILFILPLILFMVIGIPPYIAVMGWSFVYPILIIANLGNRGYVWGIVKNTYTHHTMSRSLHLTFDKSPRIFRVIFYRFFSTVMLIISVVTYVVMIVIVILFSVYFFSGNIGTVKGTNFQTFAISLSFLFGIIGYFRRFWNKKIKFRWIDVLLAAWLIASVGINILTNFMVLRLFKGLSPIFETWDVTRIITLTDPIPGGNHVLFIPVALIEEVMFLVLVNYYLFSKNSKFFLEARLNLMEYAAANFIPIPLFNFVHHSNPELRRAAKRELVQMYARLPVRNDIKYTHKRYMYPLFDALSDSNPYNREVATEILDQTIKSHPDKILPQIIRVLQSGNSDAQLQLGMILKRHPVFVSKIPSEYITRLLVHPNFQLKRLGVDLVYVLPKQPSILSNEIIFKGLSNADYEFQAKCMEIAIKFGLVTDIKFLIDQMKGTNAYLQQAALQSFLVLLNREDLQLTNMDINHIIKELHSGNTPTREAAILSISKLRDLSAFKIPLEPFLAGIKSQIHIVRDASEKVLRTLLPNMKSNDLSQMLNIFIDLSESADEDTIQHILPLLGRTWKSYPQKVLSILTKYIRSSHKKIQDAVENALNEIAREDPQLVLNALLPIQDEPKYLRKSVLQSILYSIGSQNPESIKLLEIHVGESNITVKKNALNAMEDLSEKFAMYFDQHLLIEEIKTESFSEIRLKMLSVLLNVIRHSSSIEQDIVEDLYSLLESGDWDLRKRTCTIFEEITKIDSSLLSLDTIQKLSRDTNPSIRESAAKMLRYFIGTQKQRSIQLLNELIDDEKWIVQSAVIDTLMHCDLELESKLIGKIVGMIDQPDEWLSRKVLEYIQFVGKKHPDQIPIQKLQLLSTHPNPHIRSMVLKIIELLGFETAWELLITMMQDKDPQVRDQAARSLVTVTKDMAISNLYSRTLKYFSDETNILLQRSLANALQRIVKYERREIRSRLIGILKIRCQLSQDPVLCQIWHELEEK